MLGSTTVSQYTSRSRLAKVFEVPTRGLAVLALTLEARRVELHGREDVGRRT